MDRRIFFCGGAAAACLILAELAEDDFRGIALVFAGVYALYTLLFALDDLSKRHAARTAERRRPSRASQAPRRAWRPGTTSRRPPG